MQTTMIISQVSYYILSWYWTLLSLSGYGPHSVGCTWISW